MHELLERLEAHLTAKRYYSVIANMRGASAREVSERLLAEPELAGLSVRRAALFHLWEWQAPCSLTPCSPLPACLPACCAGCASWPC